MDRKQQQRHLMAKVGAVLSAPERVIENPVDFSEEERRHIRAQFLAEHNRLGNEVASFCHTGEAHYDVERAVAENIWDQVRSLIKSKEFVEDPPLVGQNLPRLKQHMLDAIAAVPVRVVSISIEAGTPFSAYCRVKELFETTRKNLVYVDRYVDDSLLYLYFEGVPVHVEVTILTWPITSLRGNVDAYRRFMAASKLYALQRPTTYTLSENAAIHARRLLCDGQLYKLDDSLRSAAVKTSFQLLRDPTGMQDLQREIVGAKVLFGRSVTPHP